MTSFSWFWPPWRGLGDQEHPQECSWGQVDMFRHLENSILTFWRKVTIFFVQVIHVRTGDCYLGSSLHFPKSWKKANIMLTLLPEQLEWPMSTLWKAFDLPYRLVTIPGSLMPSLTLKTIKNVDNIFLVFLGLNTLLDLLRPRILGLYWSIC